MAKRLNEKFLESYIALDKNCAEKFSLQNGGITEYINRLTDARAAHNREEVLQRLKRYRYVRNKLAHEPGALKNLTEIEKGDVSWIKKFDKAVARSRDPISKYLKAEKQKKLGGFILVGALLIFAAVFIAFWVLR